jgi:hypothetical protein
MICATCGGYVTWRGPMSNLTHTECAGCGAINNQITDIPDDDDEEEIDGDSAVPAYYGL